MPKKVDNDKEDQEDWHDESLDNAEKAKAHECF